jgi:ParB-like chromosome segregation protein Spo0J
MKPKTPTPGAQSASGIPVHCRGCELADVADLVPHPENPNKHSDEQIATLARIIRARGWRHPIIVSRLSGRIVAGHGRLLAAKVLQVAQVPIERQAFDSEDAEREFLLADNRLAELAERDNALLKDLLEQLDCGQATDAGQLLADLTGYDAAERERLALQVHVPEGNKPIDEEAMSDTKNECPKCGFKW